MLKGKMIFARAMNDRQEASGWVTVHPGDNSDHCEVALPTGERWLALHTRGTIEKLNLHARPSHQTKLDDG